MALPTHSHYWSTTFGRAKNESNFRPSRLGPVRTAAAIGAELPFTSGRVFLVRTSTGPRVEKPSSRARVFRLRKSDGRVLHTR